VIASYTFEKNKEELIMNLTRRKILATDAAATAIALGAAVSSWRLVRRLQYSVVRSFEGSKGLSR
jgi:hypothetical protein